VKRRKVRDQEINPQETWELGWWRKDFRKLRTDPAFCAVVTLARAVNILRFVQSAIVGLPRDARPETRRQTMNAFYLAGAVLVEVEALVNGIARYFKDDPDYQDVLPPVVHSAAFARVVSRFRKLRKWAAFHFDEQAAREVLQGRDSEFERFMSSQGTRNKDYYFDLGDIVAFGLVSEQFESAEAFEAWFREFLETSADVTNDVLLAADTFIGSQLVKWNAVRRQVRDMPSILEFETRPESEAVRALTRFRDDLRRAESEPYEWKWAIISGHNAIQNFMVAALDSTSREALFTKNANREFEDWWYAKAASGDAPEPALAAFMKLYGRLGLPFDVRGDMDAVNAWRNDFSHFVYSTWAVSVRRLPRRFLGCLRVIEFVGWAPGRFDWQDVGLRADAQRAHSDCVAILERLRTSYEPSA
jgi:hypothetical protein